MKKLTWEDLLPKRSVTKTDEETGYKYYYYYTDRDKIIEILRQAERDGKVRLKRRVMSKSNAKDFADTIKNNPKKIIAWAKREIKEYEKLIRILEARVGVKH